jgi:3D (Asp-Asp-Asp) domain-containing protein
MKNKLFSRVAVVVVAQVLSSCAIIDEFAGRGRPLEPEVKHEAHRELAVKDDSATKPVRAFCFKLNAPSYARTLLADKSWQLRHIHTTAYCHEERDHLAYGRLAAGGCRLKFGSVCSAAADWSRFPIGTRFRIKNQPDVLYEVDDYGSALVGSATIDLYRPTLGSMNAWGVRDVDIEIVKWGSY